MLRFVSDLDHAHCIFSEQFIAGYLFWMLDPVATIRYGSGPDDLGLYMMGDEL